MVACGGTSRVLFFRSVDSEEGEGFCVGSGSERLILEGWPKRERPGKDPAMTLASFSRRSGQPKAAAKYLIRVDLAFLLFRSWGAAQFTLCRMKGCAPFGKEMHPKKRTPEDRDLMIWPAAKIRSAGIRTRRRETWRHIFC